MICLDGFNARLSCRGEARTKMAWPRPRKNLAYFETRSSAIAALRMRRCLQLTDINISGLRGWG